ncbi:MAG: retropepsin-like aspartic protease [Rudaea sp.]|uniref:retropepsin-like aspartic protease family protein n=1 Tax=Rudaea sp. TaxID=2136325 RepID=UPI0039E354F8
MHAFPGRLVLLLAAACTANANEPPPAAGTEAAARSVESENLDKIFKAMGEADSSVLFDLYASKDSIVHVLAAMAIERTRFNLDAASKDATVCEDNLLRSRPDIALLCGRFRAGNLRLAGKWQTAHEAEADLVRRYRGRAPELDKRLDDMQKLLARQAGVAQFSIDGPSANVTFAFRRDANDRDSLRPILAARANGRDVDVLLDTGATDMVLDEGKARDLGVEPLDERGHVRGWLSHGVEIRRGVLDALQIGPITLRNVPVNIVPRHNALIGINLLAPLGVLRMTGKSLTIDANDTDAPACERDMQAGTDLAGHRLRLIPEFLVNDQPHRVMLDTGTSMFLIGTKAALDEVTRLRSGQLAMNDIGGYHPFASAEAAKVKMQIDRQRFNVYFIVYTESTFPFDIALGAGALKDMDYVLDFRRHRLCFPMHPNLH